MPEVNDKIRITLQVYDTPFSINVNRDEEEYYRKAAKTITDTVNSYANKFLGRKSEKELLLMSMIDIALRLSKESTKNDATPFVKLIEKLTAEVEETLK